MKRFFRWLFSLFKPDKKGYVRNIQEGSPSSGGRYARTKTKQHEHSVLAWILTKDVLSNEENQQGITVKINLRQGAEFNLLKLKGNPKITSKKFGLSQVKHLVTFTLLSEETCADLIAYANQSKPVSFIYRNQYGESYFYGKQIGMLLGKKDGTTLEFKGEEDDVFYAVSTACFEQVIP